MELTSSSRIIYVALAVGVLCLGIIMVCTVWPACWIHRRVFIKKKKKPGNNQGEIPGVEDTVVDIWERHPHFWLPSHDISAGDSSQASDLEDSEASESKFPTERTSLKDGHMARPHYRSTHRKRDSSADSSSSLSDTGLSDKVRAIRISAVEARILWEASSSLMTLSLHRLVLRSFKHKKADLVLRIYLHLIPSAPSESSSGGETSDESIEPLTSEREIYTIGVVGKKEQVFTDKIQVDIPGGLKNNVLKFRVGDRRNWQVEDALLEGQVALDDLNIDAENFICVIMRPRPPTPGMKGEAVMSLCYLPTAEKLSIAILECKDLKTKEADEKYTAVYIKVALVHRGRALKKKKTKSKAISPNVMFNETYTFDVPRKHVQSISLILTFKQLIYYPGVPRMAEKTIGKCVLGAAAQTDSAQLHWREMIMNARKPIIQWQALW